MNQAHIFDAVRSPRGKGRADGALNEIKPLQLDIQSTVGEAAFIEQCKSLAAKYGDRFEPLDAMQAKVAAGESLTY